MKNQPFADKPVRWRQCGDRNGADQEACARPGHAPKQSPVLFHVPGVGGVHERAGPQKQQRLEHRMIDGVIEPGQQTERRKLLQAIRQKDHPGADAEQNDPDVLDTVEGEQTLEIVFHERVHDAQQGRDRADHQDGEPPPPGKLPPEKVEVDPDQRVDRGLDHHPRHQRGDVCGRGRMRAGQPDMEGDDAGLGAKPDQRREKHQRPQGFGQELLRMSERLERERARSLKKAQKRQDDERGADVHHDQIEEARVPHVGLLMLRDDQEIRDQRHQFPDDQEEETIVGENDQRHGG